MNMVFSGVNNQLASKTEEEVFKTLELAYIEPELEKTGVKWRLQLAENFQIWWDIWISEETCRCTPTGVMV